MRPRAYNPAGTVAAYCIGARHRHASSRGRRCGRRRVRRRRRGCIGRFRRPLAVSLPARDEGGNHVREVDGHRRRQRLHHDFGVDAGVQRGRDIGGETGRQKGRREGHERW